jgi:muramoyltetrapeptide carboxypeptidase
MIRPPSLQKGDTIAVVSTARKVSVEDIEPGIQQLKSWGMNVEPGKNLFASLNQFAGSDEQRSEDFQIALNNPDVKAIWFARGGYGTVRIIDGINWTSFKKNPKWLIGYSDVTVIHSHVHRHCGVETLHAPMIFNLKKITNDVAQSLEDALFNKKLQYTFGENFYSDMNRSGEGKGQLVGGNLSILYSMLGSQTDLDTKGKILFLEDIDEYLYHIDRMMMAMKRAGKLEHLKGLVVGGMTDMKDNKVRFNKTAEEIVSETVAEYSYPVLYGFPSGHIPDNRALILGREVTMKVNAEPEIIFG